jgi:hypothetical protein
VRVELEDWDGLTRIATELMGVAAARSGDRHVEVWAPAPLRDDGTGTAVLRITSVECRLDLPSAPVVLHTEQVIG